MNLVELKEKVDSVIEAVKEDGHPPEEIEIALQIDSLNSESIFTEKGEKIEVMYDNFGCVSGCVINAWKE